MRFRRWWNDIGAFPMTVVIHLPDRQGAALEAKA
jgi:hypothetical protein